jgi:glycosyltransferase involved in cell wall biosynthesis
MNSPAIKTDYKISFVIPAHNEEGNLNPLTDQLLSIIDRNVQYEIIFVDDGSTDNTLPAIKKLQSENKQIHYISLSRNFGHQNALKSGIDHSTGDCVISLDADLQHPVNLISEMIQLWQKGNDIVYTIRKDHKTVSLLKRFSSRFFYRLINLFSEITLEPGAADFRLIDRSVADVIRNNHEYNLFIRGYISWLGFKSAKILYSADERLSGKTKYSFKKMMSFAIDGLTSFSIKPLRIAIFVGAFISFLAFIYALYAIYIYAFTDRVMTGWTSLLVSVLFLGGLQLLFLGFIGEYIGRIFIQTKNRPSYVIRESDLT